MPQCLYVYLTGLYLINYISYTAVQTNDTDSTQQGVFEKKRIRIHRIVFGGVCLCFCDNE